MARPQKNFTLGPETKAAFEHWCEANGYNQKTVFLSGWLALMEMTHAERMALFGKLGDWAKGGYRTAATPEPPAPKAKLNPKSNSDMLRQPRRE